MACPQVIEATVWDGGAAKHLEGVGGLPACVYEAMVQSENLTIFAVMEGPERVGTVLMRWEVQENGNQEAVIVAAGGRAQGDITGQALPLLIDAARMVQSNSIRLHTRRPGLVRKLAHLAHDNEIVLSWRL